MSTRRRLLLAGVGMLSLPALARLPAPPIDIEVWKSPTCGCCKDWVAHMQANGFRVKVHDVGNTAARSRLGLAEKFGSCHTARAGRYAIEGHVPAQDVLRVLRERPQGMGLAVPGMPVGSPGMDGPAYGSRRDPFDVLLVAADGSSSVFSSYFK